MTDREKVIKGIHQHCEGSLFDRCGECPYYEMDFGSWEESKFKCRDELLSDALALLKKQEPKLVANIHKHYNNVTNPNVPWVGRCPKCNKLIEGRNLTRFCKYCGQAVKWE